MRNTFIPLLVVLVNLSLTAQESNILLDRSFWRSAPDVAEVKAKIAEGHDPLAMTSAAFDPVTYATIDHAPYQSVKYLLSLQDDPAHTITHDGRNYLMWAAYAGEMALVKDLIEMGSDLQMYDDHGYNVITFCATTGQDDPAIYDVLIEHGADVTATNRDGANALLLIAKHLGDDLTMIDYFVDHGLKRNATDDDGNGLFNYAAIKGNIPLMKKAIEWGLPHTERNKQGGNAMLFASRGYRGSVNDLSVYEFLAEQGVDPNVATYDGETPLHNLAFRTKDVAVFQFFIERGVDINQTDASGNTMLLNAIRGGNEAIALKYLPKVADINHQNKDGHAALTFAVRRNLPTVVKTLLETEGIVADVIDKDGNNLAGHLFLTFNPKQQASFVQIMDLLTQENIDFRARQAGDNTLLHYAVDQQSPALIDLALSKGVEVNAKNSDGLTALHYAAMKAKDATLLQHLIEKGADTSITTDFDETVYDLAAENEILQKSGFDLNLLKR